MVADAVVNTVQEFLTVVRSRASTCNFNVSTPFNVTSFCREIVRNCGQNQTRTPPFKTPAPDLNDDEA